MTVAHAPAQPQAQPNAHAGIGFVVLITVIAALGGLLFGFDQGVISGAIGFLSTRFEMVLFFVLMFLVPETPRFLFEKGQAGTALTPVSCWKNDRPMVRTRATPKLFLNSSRKKPVFGPSCTIWNWTRDFSASTGPWILVRIAVLWLGTYLVTQFFPILLEKWGTPMTFVLFGFFCLVMCVFTYKLVPENKGKTLEQIQVELTTAGAKN